jgi:Fe-S-cluster-containing dehydrogenase component
MGESEAPLQRLVKLLDQSRCIGCHACTTACKSENNVPLGVTRTYMKSVDVGLPDAGDVQARERDRRLQQVRLHWMQCLHRRVPVRRDLHQPRGR